MTQEEYTSLTERLAVLKEVQTEYPGRTIENIIQQMESIKKEIIKSC